jgi:hypothetical protein
LTEIASQAGRLLGGRVRQDEPAASEHRRRLLLQRSWEDAEQRPVTGDLTAREAWRRPSPCVPASVAVRAAQRQRGGVAVLGRLEQDLGRRPDVAGACLDHPTQRQQTCPVAAAAERQCPRHEPTGTMRVAGLPRLTGRSGRPGDSLCRFAGELGRSLERGRRRSVIPAGLGATARGGQRRGHCRIGGDCSAGAMPGAAILGSRVGERVRERLVRGTPLALGRELENRGAHERMPEPCARVGDGDQAVALGLIQRPAGQPRVCDRAAQDAERPCVLDRGDRQRAARGLVEALDASGEGAPQPVAERGRFGQRLLSRELVPGEPGRQLKQRQGIARRRREQPGVRGLTDAGAGRCEQAGGAGVVESGQDHLVEPAGDRGRPLPGTRCQQDRDRLGTKSPGAE